MAFELGRTLILADAVAPESLAHALLVVANTGVCLPRALLLVDAIDVARLEEHLARAEAPTLRHVVPVAELVDRLPHGLCERLLAIPVRQDPRTKTIDVAVVDARDTHARDEIAFWLEAPVRLVRTTFAAMDAALKRTRVVPERGVRALAPPIWVPATKAVRTVADTPLYGTRAAREPDDDESRTEIGDFPLAADPNIPIPLSRRSLNDISIVEVDGASIAISVAPNEPPAEEPIVELRQRKATSAPAPAPAAHAAPAEARAPATSRGPYALGAPTLPFADIGTILTEIRGATDRDRIVDLLLAGARTVARRVAVFAVKRDELGGWACTPELGDRAALRRVRVPLASPSLLVRAVEGGTHLGRLAKIDAHAALFELMGGAPANEVAVTGVRIEGRPGLVVLADEVGDTLIATRRLDELARVAGDALAAMLRQKAR